MFHIQHFQGNIWFWTCHRLSKWTPLHYWRSMSLSSYPHFLISILNFPSIYSILNLFLSVVWPANGKKPLCRLWCWDWRSKSQTSGQISGSSSPVSLKWCKNALWRKPDRVYLKITNNSNVFYLSFTRGDRTQTGHILGDPNRRDNADMLDTKGISPVAFTTLRMLTHMAMLIGAERHPQVILSSHTCMSTSNALQGNSIGHLHLFIHLFLCV